jgi:WD40 repeat protein
MAGILISYRGGDAPGHAGRLFDRLRARLPKHRIRKDATEIAPGEDFGQAIENAVSSSGTILVMIGREWMSSVSSGGRRVDDSSDPVRLEIGAALRLKRRVIPVLVAGASMPPEQALPSEIRGLARRQAVELRDGSWDQDVENLIAAIESQKTAVRREPTRPSRYRRTIILGGMLGIFVTALIAWLWLASDSSSPLRPVVRLHPEVTLVAHSGIGAITALPRQRIASLKSDEVTVWNLASEESESLYKEYGIASITGLPDGRLALGFWGYVELLNADKGKVEETIDLHDPYGDRTDTSIDQLILLRDAMLLSFSSVSVGFCDLKSHLGHVIPMGAVKRFAALGEARVALLPSSGGIGVWNSRDKKAEILLPGQPDAGPEKDLALLPDGRIATTSQDGALTLWNLETGKQKTLRPGGSGGERFDNRLFALPDGRLMEVRSDSVDVWTVSRDRPDREATIARRNAMWMADPLLLADGRLILAMDDGGILVWNPQTGQSDAILEGHTKPVKHFLLLDDDRLASVAEDTTIRIWKLPPGGSRLTPSGRGR